MALESAAVVSAAFGLNAVTAVIAWLLGVDKPVFNLDYGLLPLVGLMRAPRALLAGVGMVVFSVDVLFVLNNSFPVFGWYDLLDLAEAGALPAAIVLRGVVGLALLALMLAWLARSRALRSWASLGAFTLAGVALLVGERLLATDANLAYSPVRAFYKILRDSGDRAWLKTRFSANSQLLPLARPSAVYEEVRAALASGDERVVLILVESWSRPLAFSDAEWERHVRERLLPGPSVGRPLRLGSDPTWGTTIHGEMKTLCNVRLEGIHIAEPPPTCLPALARTAGYTTESVHGYTSRFFRRRDWYPKIGFDHSFWRDDIPGSICAFAFTGRCDADMLPFLMRRVAAARGRLFVYGLTLDSHLPITGSARRFAAALAGSELADTAVYAVLIDHTLRAVGELVRALPSTRFIIAGDHPPHQIFKVAADAGISATTVPYAAIDPLPDASAR